MSRNLFFALAMLLTGSTTGWAQLVGTSELYGEGVHRYFAHDYQGADQLLTQAIESGSQDPRAYFFRGLARELQGGGGEMDFEEGARLEASGRSGPQIGYSLTRVQGAVRSKIEVARRQARVLAAQQRALMQQAAPAVELNPVPAPAAGASDPFGGEGMRSGDVQAAPADTAPPANDATTDPFGDEAKPAADATDPFGGAAPEPAPAADDPFGTSTPPAAGASEDPFNL